MATTAARVRAALARRGLARFHVEANPQTRGEVVVDGTAWYSVAEAVRVAQAHDRAERARGEQPNPPTNEGNPS